VAISLAFVTSPRAHAWRRRHGGRFAQVQAIVGQRCTPCHSAHPSDEVFTSAPNGVIFDTPEQIRGYLRQIETRVVTTHNMPLGNKTG
jgi:uncharacterized membrane protein